MNKIKQTIEKSTDSMDKKVKQKITTSIYGTRIYLFFLTIINFIWLYCMDVKINLFSIISACIILLFLFFLYRKNGKEYFHDFFDKQQENSGHKNQDRLFCLSGALGFSLFRCCFCRSRFCWSRRFCRNGLFL